MLASRKMRTAPVALTLALSGQDLGELRLGSVELAYPLRRIALDRKGNGGAQEDAFGRRFGNQHVICLEAHGFTELGWQGYHSAAIQGDGRFHSVRITEILQYGTHVRCPGL